MADAQGRDLMGQRESPINIDSVEEGSMGPMKALENNDIKSPTNICRTSPLVTDLKGKRAASITIDNDEDGSAMNDGKISKKKKRISSRDYLTSLRPLMSSDKNMSMAGHSNMKDSLVSYAPVKNWKRSSVQRTCEAEAVQAFQYFWKSCWSVFHYQGMVRSLETGKRTILWISKAKEAINYLILSTLLVKSLMQNLDQQICEVEAARKFKFLNVVRNQKSRKMTIISTILPEHVIIYEILPRLPVKSLMRFKSVCKSWQAIISGNDPNLIALHLQQSRQQIRVLVTPADQHGSGIVSCHFVQDSNICQSEFIVDMPDLEVMASTCMPSHWDGLLLFSSATELHVCNPATRELATLPTSTHINSPSRTQALFTPYNAAAIGHDPRTNKYKVVRFFYRWSDLEARACSLGVEILTLGSETLCWIASQRDPPYPIWPLDSVSSSDGVIYWLIDNTLHASSAQAIMSFNIIDGKFGIIPPPPIWKKNLDNFQNEALICGLDGNLCCTIRGDPLRRIYMYTHGTWHVRYSQKVEMRKRSRLASPPLGTTYDGRILFNVEKNFLYYNPREHTTELIPKSSDSWPTHSEGNNWFHVISYIESMLPIRQNICVKKVSKLG